MKKNVFTLIELLTVIGIIAILASLMLPITQTAKDRVHKVETKERMYNLQLALMKYEAENQIFPVDYSSGDMIISDTNTVEYDALIEHLSCIDVNQDSIKDFNTRKHRYLNYHPPATAPAPTADGRTLTDSFKNANNKYGKRLGIAFDLDGNNSVYLDGTILNGKVFIWSFGKNNKNEWGKGDDVVSWE